MKKRLWMLLLTLVLVIGLMTVSALALDATGSCGDTVSYSFDADTGTLTISGTGEIPNYMSSGSAASPFNKNADIRHVAINEGVTYLGDRTFMGCANLIDITLPASLEGIGEFVFTGCSAHNTITVAEGSSSFSAVDGVLFNKDKTTLIRYPVGRPDPSYTIPDGVTTIGSYAFSASLVNSVTIPDTVTTIEDRAFWTAKLTSVTIPDTVTTIEAYTFSETGLERVEIPEGVTTIKDNAFYKCEALTSIKFSNSVTKCEDMFEQCSSLARIDVAENNTAFTSVDGVLFDKAQTTLVKYPAAKSETAYTIPDSVTAIGAYAFDGAKNLESVSISNNVTSIETHAFSNSGLRTVEIPGTIHTIGDFAFYNNTNLYNVVIGNGVQTIGSEAFSGCRLPSLTLPDSVETIGNKAFFMNRFSRVEFGSRVQSIGEQAFASCGSLKDVVFHGPVPNTLSTNAFMSIGDDPVVYYHTGHTSWETNGTVKPAVKNKFRSEMSFQTIDHTFEAVEYVWSDDCGSCTAMRVCVCGTGLPSDAIEVSAQQTKDPTCTQNGEMTHTAYFDVDWAQTQTKVTPIPSKGHNYKTTGIVTKDPTQTEEGVMTYTCANGCGIPKTEAIPAMANPFTDVAPGQFYYVPALWAAETGITTGTSATTFSPNRVCTRAEIVTFIWRACGSPAPTGTDCGFTDVDPSGYYYDAMLWAVENGITNGTGGTKFSPDKTCTRAEVVTFLHRANGSQAPTQTDNAFTDVKAGAFYYDAVLWAVENGITSGTGGSKFSPDTVCTRSQVVTFLYRAQ